MGAFLALVLALTPANAAVTTQPSFDCAKATTPGERLVCGDPALAAADRDLAQRYQGALAGSADPAGLRARQREALKVRNACRTRDCVAHWYDARKTALDAPARAPLSLPVGGCTSTQVASVGPRVEGAPDSGVFVAYANGLTQVSYDPKADMGRAQAGDPVRLCVVSRPRHCPSGDARGAVYAARDGRAGLRWTAADSSHLCGGA